MRPATLTRILTAAVATSIAAAQTTAGAGNLLINGTLAAGGVATLDAQRKVGIASAGDDSAVTFTVFGTDQMGRAISEALAGPNANTVSTTLDFLTVTRVAVSAAVGVAVTVGTTGVGASQPVPLDLYLPFGSTVSVVLTGAMNYTVQVTNDDVYNNTNPLWVSHPTAGLVAASTSQVGNTANAYRAMRLLTNSGAGSAVMVVTQQGLTV